MSERPTEDPRREARLHLWAGVVLLAVAGFLVNYLAFRHYARWDWTAHRLYTLSERTQKLLREELDRDTDVYVFLSRSEPAFADVEELLGRYRALSERVRVTVVDPDRAPGEYRRLLEKFGLRAAALQTGEMTADVALVVTDGTRHVRVKRDDLLGLDFESVDDEQGPKVDVSAERAVSGAIVDVLHGEPSRVCVASGHGEWSVGGEGRDLFALRDELRSENVEMEALATLGLRRVPERCDAVFVLGPQRPYTKEEAEVLERYVRGGGRLLLALDPVFDGERLASTGLEEMAARLGVRVDQDVVLELDRARLLTESPAEPFLVVDWGEHDLVEPLARTGARVAVHLVRSLALLDTGAGGVLARTSPQAYGERNPEQLSAAAGLKPGTDDVAGPLAVAVAVELDAAGAGAERGEAGKEKVSDGRKGRLVVLGDSDWLQPDFMNIPQFANADLAAAITGWLVERRALVAIAPRKIDAQAIAMTDADLDAVLFRVVVLLPLAAMLLGVAVWWSRRQ